jgi:hypothetical protein
MADFPPDVQKAAASFDEMQKGGGAGAALKRPAPMDFIAAGTLGTRKRYSRKVQLHWQQLSPNQVTVGSEY